MRIYGPINSGSATGGAGVATSSATSTTPVVGFVAAIAVRYNDSPPSTTDVTVAGAGTNHLALTLLTLTNANTNVVKNVRHAIHDDTGAVITFDGTNEVYDLPALADFVTVTIAQSNDADSVDVWLFLV